MKTRLGSLFLLFVLASGALAGMPLHFGENGCGMQDMMGMDCCKKAQLQVLTPEVADAKLCCALDCSQNVTTAPSRNVRPTAPLLIDAPSHPATALELPAGAKLIPKLDYMHGPPGLPPVYLRTLTLLI
jgi:hypothetical protein